MTQDSPIAIDVDSSGIALVTLTRPQAANARNQAMRKALLDAYADIAGDTSVRCVVLTGAGPKYFCSGMDLKESARPEPIMESRARLSSARDIEVLARLPIPTIAMVNGLALGGGLEMALACDLRYMAVEAEVGLPELAYGLVPAGGATRRLPPLIGPAKTYELIYLGTRLTGTEAEALGLVNKAVPRSELNPLVESVASRIASLDRHALAAVKRLISAGTVMGRTSDSELDALLLLTAEQPGVQRSG